MQSSLGRSFTPHHKGGGFYILIFSEKTNSSPLVGEGRVGVPIHPHLTILPSAVIVFGFMRRRPMLCVKPRANLSVQTSARNPPRSTRAKSLATIERERE